MLHIFKIGNVQFSDDFYEGIYIPDRLSSYWIGQLPDILNLQEYPNPTDIKVMLDCDFKGEWVRERDPTSGGMHLTFSAPKGVSIAALVLDDKRMVLAHEYAVMKTLEHLQSRLGYRITKNKVTRPQLSNDICGAVFHRCQSRSGDPQLHTQVMLFNVCRRDDGKFCALDFSALAYGKKLFGLVYRTMLAYELGLMGVSMEWQGDLVDIAHFPEKIVRHFSSRSDAIHQMLKQDGVENKDTSHKHIQAIAKMTAPTSRQHNDFFHLKMKWSKSWTDSQNYVVPGIDQEHESMKLSISNELEFIIEEFDHRRQGKLGLFRNKLVLHALLKRCGEISIFELEDQIDVLIEDGEFIQDGYPATLFNEKTYEAFISTRQLKGQESHQQFEDVST